MKKMIILILGLILLIGNFAVADSELYKEFKKKYNNINVDLVNYQSEKFTVDNFIYKKDLATFTFTEGIIFLARYVDDRPTTAVFYGKGHAQIDIPSYSEQIALESISKKNNVNEEFELAIIHFSDNFDLKLKEHATGEIKKLKWKYYSILKEQQADFYFL